MTAMYFQTNDGRIFVTDEELKTATQVTNATSPDSSTFALSAVRGSASLIFAIGKKGYASFGSSMHELFEAAKAKDDIQTMTVDPLGRVWFGAASDIFCFDGTAIHEYPTLGHSLGQLSFHLGYLLSSTVLSAPPTMLINAVVETASKPNVKRENQVTSNQILNPKTGKTLPPDLWPSAFFPVGKNVLIGWTTNSGNKYEAFVVECAMSDLISAKSSDTITAIYGTEDIREQLWGVVRLPNKHVVVSLYGSGEIKDLDDKSKNLKSGSTHAKRIQYIRFDV
jgi:hypothetical protein